MYLGVWSITIWGRPDSFNFIRFLSMMSMETVCLLASIISRCSACFFWALLPKIYKVTIRAIIMTKTTKKIINPVDMDEHSFIKRIGIFSLKSARAFYP